jgi:hypothetical protein
MSKIMIDRIKQISIEMKAIVNRSQEDGRITNMEDQDRLEHLAEERDELISCAIFYGRY